MNCIVTESRGRVLFIISISWIKYTFGQNILGLMFTPATRSSEYFVTTVMGAADAEQTMELSYFDLNT